MQFAEALSSQEAQALARAALAEKALSFQAGVDSVRPPSEEP